VTHSTAKSATRHLTVLLQTCNSSLSLVCCCSLQSIFEWRQQAPTPVALRSISIHQPLGDVTCAQHPSTRGKLCQMKTQERNSKRETGSQPVERKWRALDFLMQDLTTWSQTIKRTLERGASPGQGDRGVQLTIRYICMAI